MNIRIFSASLFCAALLSGCSTASIRPEVAQPLQMAKEMRAEGKFSDAMTQMHIAAEVPHQNYWERLAVASVQHELVGNPGFSPCDCGGISDDKYGIQEPPPDHPPNNMQ